MRDLQTVDEMVKEHLAASERLMKKIGNDSRKARDFLIRAGILNKQGTALRGHRPKRAK
jgi:hypothetical protein